MGARRKAREAAVQVLYQIDLSEVAPGPATDLFWRHLHQGPEEEIRAFTDELVRGYGHAREQVDEAIRQASRHWRLERMARVDRNIMRLAVYELLLRHDIPARVTLNEAIELAKRFGDENSPAFINGVLDRVATQVGRDAADS